jgi:hypothetical protein
VGVVTFRGAILTTSVSQTTASANAFQTISSWTENLDTDGFFTTGNANISIPTGLGGVYHVSGVISSANQTAASHAELAIFINGVSQPGATEWTPNLGGYTHFANATAIVSLLPGDSVTLRFRSNVSGLSISTAELRVHFLGA